MPVVKIFDKVGSNDPLTGAKTNSRYNPKFSAATAEKKGVYILFENQADADAKRAQYVGHSKSNLYKTIIRHFQEWNSATERKYVAAPPYKNFVVKVIRMDDKSNADIIRAETLNIIRYSPPNNERKNKRAARVLQSKADSRQAKAEEKALKDPAYIEQYLKGIDSAALNDTNDFLNEIDDVPF